MWRNVLGNLGRSEAFYDCDEEYGEHPQVKTTRENGLRARVFDARTPPDVITCPTQLAVRVYE